MKVQDVIDSYEEKIDGSLQKALSDPSKHGPLLEAGIIYMREVLRSSKENPSEPKMRSRLQKMYMELKKSDELPFHRLYEFYIEEHGQEEDKTFLKAMHKVRDVRLVMDFVEWADKHHKPQMLMCAQRFGEWKPEMFFVTDFFVDLENHDHFTG
jgi:hypothetical protein